MMKSQSLRTIGRAALGIAGALAFGGTAVAAQSFPELQPGVRIQFRAPIIVDGRVTGKIVSRTPESIVVVGEREGEYIVAFGALSELKVSRGVSHADGALRGALVGTGLGLGVGAIIGASSNSRGQGGYTLGPPTFAQGLLIGAGGGLAIGAVLGGISGLEHWEGIRFPVSVALLPVHRGVGVRIVALNR